MKTTLLALLVLLANSDLRAQMPPPPGSGPRSNPHFMSRTNHLPVKPTVPGAPTESTAPTPFTPPSGAAAPAAQPGVPSVATAPVAPAAPAAPPEETVPAGFINFQGVDVNQVLEVYAQLVGRTILRPASLPGGSIILKTETPLTKSEAVQALQAVLALNGISVVNIGDKFVKVLPSTDANSAGADFNQASAAQLPDLGSYVTRIVQLKFVKPSEMIPVIQPFAKLQNSILAIDSNGILVLRDYAENVKRMMEMIDKIDVNVPAEYISEVIPIKYAVAEDIASALSSLGGGSGGTVSIGGSTAPSPISGVGGGQRLGGFGTQGAFGNTPGSYPGGPNSQPSTFGPRATMGGTPSPGNTFQSRLQAIINRASGGGGGQQEQIQLFGQFKMIADARSNSLLVFATKQDMETIKEIIGKLDVLLSQVLIESAIIDYSLGPNTLNYSLSAAQEPQNYAPSVPAVGAGGVNNSSSSAPFLNLLQLAQNGLTNQVFGNNLGGGLSYFGNIGPRWDLALSAVQADSHATIVQTPSIMTSQAKPAQFFVGNTVPYVTASGNYGYGYQSSYSQLSVGVELDVTPFINPDGLVVMDIQQEIDALNGFTTITGVGQIPNTIKRTLSSEVAVGNKDTIMLGGFISNNKSTSRSGVPVLMDIPLLGNLFTSRNNSKQREELIVMMRPTVLKTPQLAAAKTLQEEQALPGVTAAVAEDAAEQRRELEAERKAALRRPPSGGARGFHNLPTDNLEGFPSQTSPGQGGEFFNPPPSATPADTNKYELPNP